MPLLRVIIADDDFNIRALMKDVLEEAGYEAEAYGDGQSALNAIRANPPAVAMLDIAMPVLTGEEALRRLRAEGIEVPVVIVTADVHPQRFLDVGATAVLPKPFDLAQLLAVIAEARAQPDFLSEVALGETKIRRTYASS